jgi:predicted AlkP superfamily pyrophosphatase or phosphodiesterase
MSSRKILHPVTMEVPTISGPGWSSILTGATHEVHGVFDNTFFGNRLDRTTDFLSRAAHADPSRRTFAASGWPPLLDPEGPGPVVATRLDDQRRGRHRLVIRDGETYGYRWADGDVAAFARLAIGAGPDASFVYLGEVDEAGHLYGGTSPEYAGATTRVDSHLGALLVAVEKRAHDHHEDWLVGITTDHGHLDEGGHGGSDAVLTRSFLALGRYGEAFDRGPADEVLPSEIAGILLSHLE